MGQMSIFVLMIRMYCLETGVVFGVIKECGLETETENRNPPKVILLYLLTKIWDSIVE
jgi:hypothetical protein